MLAGTYVIDSFYQGRLIMRQGEHVVAGPPSVHREEYEQLLQEAGIPTPVFIPPDKRITEPFHDKTLGTYVVFNMKRKEWLQFDKKTSTWIPIPTAAPADQSQPFGPSRPSGSPPFAP
jgi:hypothetical protein